MAFKKFTASETILKPDPRYNSKLVSKFVNCLMWDGKKTVAQKVFYDAIFGRAEAIKTYLMGFKLDAKSEINATPKDTKDHPFGVWTLPPTLTS